MEESEVLKGITRVFSARRAAGMKLVELESEDVAMQQRMLAKEKSKAERRAKRREAEAREKKGGGA